MTAARPPVDPATYVYPSFEPLPLPKLAPALYGAAAKSMTFAAAGAIALVVWPPGAAPLLTIAVTIAAVRLVIKMADLYHFKLIEKFQLQLARFRTKHKYIQIACVIGIVAVAFFSWQAACVMAVPFGVYAGVVVGLDYYAGSQATGRRRNRGDGVLPADSRVYIV